MKIFYVIPTGSFKSALISAAFLFILCAVPAFAQEKLNSGSTEITKDQESGTITIVIDGQPVALFDKDGLHVAGDIFYEGAITDVGQGRVREMIENPERENED